MLQQLSKYLHTSIHWLLYSSFFAALCALSLTVASEHLAGVSVLGTPGKGLPLQWALFPPQLYNSVKDFWLNPLHLFIFGGTILVYNVHYFIKTHNVGSQRSAWSQRHRGTHLLLILLGALLSSIGFLMLPIYVWGICAFLALLSLGYSLPLLPFGNKRRLRDFGLLKLFLLCSVWAILTVVLPLHLAGMHWSQYYYIFATRWLLMLPLCILFDIRDYAVDGSYGIHTLPQTIGIPASYFIVYVSCAAMVLIAAKLSFLHPEAPFMLHGCLIAAGILAATLGSRRPRTDAYFLLIVDGMMLFASGLTIILL